MCQFSIPFSGDAESLINRAKQEIQKAGGELTGDSNEGSFQASTPLGAIRGLYQVAGQEIALSITEKPFFISCSRIEKELSGVLK